MSAFSWSGVCIYIYIFFFKYPVRWQKLLGSARSGSTALSYRNCVITLVGRWWGQSIARAFTRCMMKIYISHDSSHYKKKWYKSFSNTLCKILFISLYRVLVFERHTAKKNRMSLDLVKLVVETRYILGLIFVHAHLYTVLEGMQLNSNISLYTDIMIEEVNWIRQYM